MSLQKLEGVIPCPMCTKSPVQQIDWSHGDPYKPEYRNGAFLSWACAGGCKVKVVEAGLRERYAHFFNIAFKKPTVK